MFHRQKPGHIAQPDLKKILRAYMESYLKRLEAKAETQGCYWRFSDRAVAKKYLDTILAEQHELNGDALFRIVYEHVSSVNVHAIQMHKDICRVLEEGLCDYVQVQANEQLAEVLRKKYLAIVQAQEQALAEKTMQEKVSSAFTRARL